MAKKHLSVVAILCLVIAAAVVAAPERNDYGVEWDDEAVKKMSREERLAYQQQYKAALAEAARRAGDVRPAQRERNPSGRIAAVPRVPGTSIAYHSGALVAWVGADGNTVGNRFDTAVTTMGGLGPVEMSGSVTMITVDMAAVNPPNIFVTFYDQLNTGAGTASRITSILTTGVTGLNVKTLAPPVNYVGTSFLAGAWQFTPDSVNVATGTVGGQGYHGMTINTGATATGYNPLAQTNAAVSVQGNVATPVELMGFEIVD